jgi:hypothetical protein
MRASLRPPAALRAPAARAAPRTRRAPRPCLAATGAPPAAAAAAAQPWSAAAAARAAALDDALSSRDLSLDPAGYFLIAAHHADGTITAAHYENTINAAGLACDPRTGEVIPCSGYAPPPPRVFAGATAKEVAVAILERPGGAGCVSCLEHAAYLGRELQRAEEALRHGTPYVQD